MKRFSTVQRVRFGDLDAMQPGGLRPPPAGWAPAFSGDLIRTFVWPSELKRSSPDAVRERVEPQIPAPDAVG